MTNPTISTKICTKCRVAYPATTEYFHKAKFGAGGLCSKCKPCKNAVDKAWYADNNERVREYKKARYVANPERYRAWRKTWNAANPERKRAMNKAWQETHPEARNAAQHRRRARVRNAGGKFTADDVTKLYKLQKGRCWWDTKHSLDNGYHIDHRIAIAKGGSNDISNIVLACPHCNTSKQDKTPAEFAGRLL